jgi:hypothetical protein
MARLQDDAQDASPAAKPADAGQRGRDMTEVQLNCSKNKAQRINENGEAMSTCIKGGLTGEQSRCREERRLKK